MSDGLALATRSGLPDALRVLLNEVPRDVWEDHPNFGEMVRFWLERHLMFRSALSQITREAESFLDRNTEFTNYAPRLSRLGGFFLNQLHGHHHIEDTHYFPQLQTLDQRLARGFEMLDRDHHALDGALGTFAGRVNAVLAERDDTAAARTAAGALHDELLRFDRFLDRHLTDEEELIVPVILVSGFDAG